MVVAGGLQGSVPGALVCTKHTMSTGCTGTSMHATTCGVCVQRKWEGCRPLLTCTHSIVVPAREALACTKLVLLDKLESRAVSDSRHSRLDFIL